MTDRRAFSAPSEAQQEQCAAVFAKITAAVWAGVDWIQIREKDMDGAKLAELAQKVISQVEPRCRVILNDRLDVACAVGAAGVHLGEKSIPVVEARRFVREQGWKEEFLIGASVHSPEAALAAQEDGADYVIFGPVFATPSKAAFGAPQGMDRLAAVCRGVSIPVLAIGGITPENASGCYRAGASGVAAIRLFQAAQDLRAVVAKLRGKLAQ